VLVALFIGLSCDTKEPDSIFDPNATANPDPVITSVTPLDSAYGEADERYTVTIVGENFGDNKDEVLVNFGSKLAKIVSYSATQMVVTPPANFTDSMRVMVSKFGSNACWEFGTYEQPSGDFHPYKLLNPISIIPGYDEYAPAEAICVDSEGNLIVCHGNKVDKVSPNGDVSSLATLKGKKAVNVQIGPDGAIYHGYLKYIMKVDTTDNTQTFNALSENVKDLDFDVNDNLYVLVKNALYLVNTTDLEETLVAEYGDTSFICMRFYNNELYFAGEYIGDDSLVSKGPYIWKSSVNGSTLTTGLTEVLDWSETNFSNLIIKNITFSSTGELIVGTTNYSLISVNLPGGGSIHKIYDKLIGSETAFRIMWGIDNYLYITTYDVDDVENIKILKINMFGTGAPYYGRN